MGIKAYSIFLILFVLIGCTCNEIKQKLLPSFNVNIPRFELTIPPLNEVIKTEIPVGALKTPINMDSTIRAKTGGTFGANAVHYVKVKKVVLKVKNADAKNNLANFESARMTIYNETTSTDIASITFPKTYTDSITIIPVNSPDITSYLKGAELAYNVYWKNRKITSKFLKLALEITVGVQ